MHEEDYAELRGQQRELYKKIEFKKQRIVAYEKGGEGYCPQSDVLDLKKESFLLINEINHLQKEKAKLKKENNDISTKLDI